MKTIDGRWYAPVFAVVVVFILAGFHGCTPAPASVVHPDGGMTFTTEEVQNLERNIGAAVGLIQRQAARIKELEKQLKQITEGKCA